MSGRWVATEATDDIRRFGIELDRGGENGAQSLGDWRPIEVPGHWQSAADFADNEGIDANMGGDWVTGAAQRTITAWFNADTFSNGQQGIFGNGGQSGNFTRFDFNAETDSGNESIMFRYQGGNIAWSANEIGGLESDEWYHLAVVVPDIVGGATFGDVDVYIDGNLLTADGGNMNSLGTLLNTTGNMNIGDTAAPFDGTIDDVQYYNVALTPEEIVSLFQNPGLTLDEINASSVPEPASVAIWLVAGGILIGFICRRRRSA